MAGTHHGTGQHSWEIVPATEIPKALMVSIPSNQTALMLSCASVLVAMRTRLRARKYGNQSFHCRHATASHH